MDEHYPHLTQHLHQSLWRKLSPRGLEHRVHVPTAITFHRLVPTASRTPRSHHKLAHRSYKYLDPEEIARAQAMARLALLRARLSKNEEAEPIPSVQPKTGEGGSQEKPKLLGKGNKGFKSQKSPKGAVKSGEKRDKAKPNKETQTQGQQSRPKLPVYRGIGETNLRLRQISRLLSMIVDCLQDLENYPKLSKKRKDFVSPHEIEIKNKRWNEFLHSSGRMLFTLKREVTSMERALKQEERNPKFLRMLASSSHSLYKLLQALKTYSEAAFQSSSWKKLLSDLVGMCHRLFAITSAIGIQPPKKVKALPKKVGSGTEDSIDSSELASSEVDTCNIDILQPEYVREKLLAIANKNLQKKRKKKENYTVAQRNEEIILSPLKYSGKSKYSNHPVEGKIQKTQTAPMKSPTHSQKVQFFGDFEKYSGRGDEPSSSALGSPSKADSMHTPHQTEKPSAHVRKQVNSEGTGINRNEQRTSVCKLQDHNVLVEETANAVVNRLMPLLGQEAEERLEKKPDAVGPPTVVLPTESIPVKDISRQIQYMLERVCKIEEEQKQNINVIGEVSRRLEQRVVFPENILQTAINQAQNVLNNLTRREERTKIFDSHLRFPTTSITIGSPYGNIMKSDHEARPEKLLKTTTDVSSYVSQDNSLKNNFVLNEVLHVPESGTITDQIKLQKEEFWASLVEQGFVKPPELAVDGVAAANKAVELMMEQKIPRNAVSKDTAAFKITHHSTNVKRDAALAKVKKEDKATLVTSLMSSYSNSFEAESSEQTPCSSKLSEEGVSKKSFSNTNGSTSVTEPDSENTENSRSGSYPSYDSESFSAKEK